MEQTLLTDQDNALVYADGGGARPRVLRSARRARERDLETAGFPRCAGGYMARNWHATLGEWAGGSRGGSTRPSRRRCSRRRSSSTSGGSRATLPLDPLDEIVARAPRSAAFLRFLARSAMDFRPPPSLLLRLRGDVLEVDLKLHGISPIVFLARAYALEAGSTARNTLERIEAAARAGRSRRRTSATCRGGVPVPPRAAAAAAAPADRRGGAADEQGRARAAHRHRAEPAQGLVPRDPQPGRTRGAFHFKLEF